VRVGDTVRRPTHPWSPAIHDLLRHLESVGFPHSPRLLGIDDEGREVLTYLPGDSGGAGWSPVVPDAGVVAMARLLRDYHRAVAGFAPPAAVWAGRDGPPAPGELICHGDFGPWNLVWRAGRPIGMLDWDYAWPARPVHDVAYALEYVAPFRPDDESMRFLHHAAPPARRHRIELFATAYGLTSTDGLIDEVITQQQRVLDRALALAAAGHQPQADWLATGVLAETARRVTWSRTNRRLFT